MKARTIIINLMESQFERNVRIDQRVDACERIVQDAREFHPELWQQARAVVPDDHPVNSPDGDDTLMIAQLRCNWLRKQLEKLYKDEYPSGELFEILSYVEDYAFDDFLP